MYNQDEITPQENLNRYINLYLKDKRNNQDEFEIRFGTKHYNTITKISFENIISKIKSLVLGKFRRRNIFKYYK